ncbi:MAG TPA: hypothetical protein VH275_11250 [Solirubrobacterales bacterium]|jgi:hypothetical protein|nr:hypothetical protein [Solirubrobacterales bacterium]
MEGEVALVHEQGQDLAILAVKASVIGNPGLREEMIAFGEREFGVRTALLAEDGRSWGPGDIVDWLSGVFVEQLPWRKFSVN